MYQIELAHGDYELSRDNILIVRLNPAPKHSVADAREAMEALKRLSRGKRYPVLVDLSTIRAVDAEARRLYARETPAFCTSTALLTTSAVGKVIANFFMSIDKPTIPTRLFDNEAAALSWLSAEGRLRKSA